MGSAGDLLGQRLPGRLVLLYATLALAMSGVGLTIPSVPFLVARVARQDGPASEAVAFHMGALTSAYAAAQFLLAPLAGRLADRYGRRPVVIAGLAGFALAQSVFAVGTSLPWLYAARILAGTFSAGLLTGSAAYVADSVAPEQRGRGMALQGAAISAGFLAGPAMSGLLTRGDFHLRLPSRHLVLDQVSLPFLAAAGLSILILLIAAIWLPESRRPDGRPDAVPSGRHDRRVTMTGRLAHVLLLGMAAQGVLGVFEAVLALYGSKVLGFGVTEIGYLFAACGGAMVVVQGGALTMARSAPVPARAMVAAGFAASAVGLCLLLFSITLPLSLAMVSLVGAGIAVVMPTLSATVANRTGADRVGTAMGLQNAAASLGQIAGPLLGTLLFSVRPGLPFVAAALGALAAALWSWRFFRSGEEASPRG